MAVVIDGTTGISTPAETVLGNLSYTGTLTGNGGIVNLGSGQVYKDASGNVGIGTSSPAATLNVAHASGVDGRGIRLTNSSNGQTWETRIGIQGIENTAYAIKNITSGNLALAIDSSGNLLVGTTSQYDVGQVCINYPDTKRGLAMQVNATGNSNQISFRNPNGIVGTISTSASGTTYATSSDYRLKEAISPMTGALAKVALLKPCTYKWKVDGLDGQGFIAHELQAVVPDCVHGEKDAVDADGNPQYQGIDTSFLVATLAAAIQELKAVVDAQAARITALEGTTA